MGKMGTDRKWNRGIPAVLLVAGIFGILIAVYAGWTFQLDNAFIRDGRVNSFSDGWMVQKEGESVALPEFPCRYQTEGGSVTMYRQLPDRLPVDSVMCLETNHQRLVVRIGDETIYEYGLHQETAFGDRFGSAWNLVPLPQVAAGEQISVTVDSPYPSGDTVLYRVLLGSKSAVLLVLLKRSISPLLFSVCIMIMGLVFLLAAAVLGWRHYEMNYRSFLYLGGFSLLASVWVITDSKAMQFLQFPRGSVYLLSFFSFMLLPIPFLLFMREVLSRGKRLMNLLGWMFLANFFACVGLYIAGIAQLYRLITVCHVLIIISMVVVLVLGIREERTVKSIGLREVLAGISVLFLSGFVSILRFYVTNTDDYSVFFRVGLIWFILLLGAGAVRKSVELLNAKLEADTYKRLAYLDTMTMLANRTAFDEAIEGYAVGEDKTQRAAFFVFDLNYLKETNDTFGHRAGDQLIIGFADCIKRTFQSVGTAYRIGGDEFAVLLIGPEQVDIPGLLEKLQKQVEETNHQREYPITYAWGYASETDEGYTGDDLYALFHRADSNMYIQKEQLHAMAHKGKE